MRKYIYHVNMEIQENNYETNHLDGIVTRSYRILEFGQYEELKREIVEDQGRKVEDCTRVTIHSLSLLHIIEEEDNLQKPLDPQAGKL